MTSNPINLLHSNSLNITFFNTSWVSDYFTNITTKISNMFMPAKVPKKRETRQIPQARLSYINGIFHSMQDCDEIVEQIEGIFKLKVNAYYLPSTGSWVQDVSKAGMILFTKPGNSVLVLGLTAHLRRLLNETAPHGRVLHIAHSAGAIITYLAAKHQLSYEEKRRIDVVTLGGGRSITKKYFPGRLVNYYSQNDPLTIVDSRAGSMLRHGKKLLRSVLYSSSKLVKTKETSKNNKKTDTSVQVGVDNKTKAYEDGSTQALVSEEAKSAKSGSDAGAANSESEELNEMYAELHEVTEQKHNTSFVFLRGLAKHPVIDHRANGPTYLIALKREARTFRRQLRETLYLEARNRSSVRLVRKQFSKMTGQRYFWSRLIQGNITLLPSVNVSQSNVSMFSSWSLPLLNWTLRPFGGHSNASITKEFKNSSIVLPSMRSFRKLCALWTGQSHFWSRRNGNNTSSSSSVSLSPSTESIKEAIHTETQDALSPDPIQFESSSNQTTEESQAIDVEISQADIEIGSVELSSQVTSSTSVETGDSGAGEGTIDSMREQSFDRTASDMTGYYMP